MGYFLIKDNYRKPKDSADPTKLGVGDMTDKYRVSTLQRRDPDIPYDGRPVGRVYRGDPPYGKLNEAERNSRRYKGNPALQPDM